MSTLRICTHARDGKSPGKRLPLNGASRKVNMYRYTLLVSIVGLSSDRRMKDKEENATQDSSCEQDVHVYMYGTLSMKCSTIFLTRAGWSRTTYTQSQVSTRDTTSKISKRIYVRNALPLGSKYKSDSQRLGQSHEQSHCGLPRAREYLAWI